ncbi:hypothetical protein GOP47_0023368 [Adiantum capillus-veneris]|uniref:PiggyBac transposable element-derived protein domain-containing protein n=1 Tax=Adiantum capillus-veneris TaxID=13818 RepID=A0A9D4Z3B7_ADICA|nr:hypothetical protein GOP47_0023368 [Adiantum capillus-veneris]
MASNQRHYAVGEVGCRHAGCYPQFFQAQECALLQVPAVWFGASWAEQEFGEKHTEVFFFGVLQKCSVKKQKFSCRFERDSKDYSASWDYVAEFVVRSSQRVHSPQRNCEVRQESTPSPSSFGIGESSHAPMLSKRNLGAANDFDAPLVGGEENITHVEEEAEETPLDPTPLGRRPGRPPKSHKRGRPKASCMPANGTLENVSPEYSKSACGGRPRKCKPSHVGGRPGPSSSPFDVANDDESDDEHASEGEGLNVWKSGDELEQEPHGTFRALPPFNGVKGPDLGHMPREFCEFHFFFMLFPLDLVDHVISETNAYAEKERQRCVRLHDSMRRWAPIDRHSFLRFMGVALGMALHYMPSKQYYWKDEVRGSLLFPNFGEKMSQTTFQQIKRFLHLRDNAQRPPRGTREHRLWQLLELEEKLNYTFQKHYNLGQCVTVDERIIPSKCKLNPCRVYNPKKPHKFGIQTLPRKGNHVFFDRYFTSVKLLEHLRSEGQGGTGTYVCNRKHFPATQMLHLGKRARGACRFAYCKKQGLVACSWMDKKEILFSSNCYGVQKGEVLRLVGDKRLPFSCPTLAVKYNACKVGCDVFDSMVLGSGYSLQSTMHGFKWWHASFWGLMDSVFTNCWIIWKEMYGKKDVCRFDFMLHMHEQLVDNAFRPYVCKRPVGEDAYNGHFPIRLHDVASKYCVICSAKRKKLLSEHKEVDSSKPSRTIWGCGKLLQVGCYWLVSDVKCWFLLQNAGVFCYRTGKVLQVSSYWLVLAAKS